MSEHLTPFEIVTALLGRPEDIAPMIDRHPKAAHHWRHGTSLRDAGDIPSARIMRALLGHAAARGIALEPRHLIWGADAAEIAALRAAPSVEAAE